MSRTIIEKAKSTSVALSAYVGCPELVKITDNKYKAICLECSGEIIYNADPGTGPLRGEVVTCSECGLELEVIKIKVRYCLKKAEVVGEDWGE